MKTHIEGDQVFVSVSHFGLIEIPPHSDLHLAAHLLGDQHKRRFQPLPMRPVSLGELDLLC
jgi:hypothetical protein